MAEITLNDGTVVTYDDAYWSNGNIEIDHFYAELISGSIIDEVGGGYWNGPLDRADQRLLRL